MSKYLYTLGLAHSCQTDTDKSGKMIYKSASPDEEALSDAARQVGTIPFANLILGKMGLSSWDAKETTSSPIYEERRRSSSYW